MVDGCVLLGQQEPGMLSKAISVSELPVKPAVSSAVLQQNGFREWQRNQPVVWMVEVTRETRGRREMKTVRSQTTSSQGRAAPQLGLHRIREHCSI